MVVCLIHLSAGDPTETFVRARAGSLPCQVAVVHGGGRRGRRPLYLGDEPLHSPALTARMARRAQQLEWRLRGVDADQESITRSYLRAFRRSGCDVVFAEYGHVGVQAMEACRRARIPLIVQFHGYDISSRPMRERYAEGYRRLFAQSTALIVNSRSMQETLIDLGAPAAKTHCVPNGVDTQRFAGGDPGRAPPVLLAVGRFTDKKAPQLTIAAFAEARRHHPDARLRMIGDGELRGACYDLAVGLGMGDAVTFLGEQPHDVVASELRAARAFVQHSLVASDGDSEGMPNSILEASAAGLPVIATRHAGIPEVVVDGETGLLVDEHDVAGMARAMERLLDDQKLAAELGRAGRLRAEQNFAAGTAVERIWEIVSAAPAQTAPQRLRG